MNWRMFWRCADRGLIGPAERRADGCDGARKVDPMHVYAAKHGSWIHGRRRISTSFGYLDDSDSFPSGLLASERASSTPPPTAGGLLFCRALWETLHLIRFKSQGLETFFHFCLFVLDTTQHGTPTPSAVYLFFVLSTFFSGRRMPAVD